MREILFRGKRMDNDKWIEGRVFRLSEDQPPFIMMVNRHGESHEVIPETVGQYTGLTDKNGKKIFEGDICRFQGWLRGEFCWVGEVHFEHQQFVISGGPNVECETPFTLVMSKFVPSCIEVIGNIHDNPELMGGADNG